MVLPPPITANFKETPNFKEIPTHKEFIKQDQGFYVVYMLPCVYGICLCVFRYAFTHGGQRRILDIFLGGTSTRIFGLSLSLKLAFAVLGSCAGQGVPGNHVFLPSSARVSGVSTHTKAVKWTLGFEPRSSCAASTLLHGTVSPASEDRDFYHL